MMNTTWCYLADAWKFGLGKEVKIDAGISSSKNSGNKTENAGRQV